MTGRTTGFSHRQGRLFIEDVSALDVAQAFGTPTYVYSRQSIEAAFDAYAHALAGRDALVCYAVKANSNLAILQLLARRGAGFDIVSGGELKRVLAAGGVAGRIIFSGVGKSEGELELALRAGIGCFNVESLAELRRLSAVATRLSVSAPVSLRVNPDVDARTHPYISTGLKESKFGVPWVDAIPTYREAAALPGLDVVGVDCHIGSQLLSDAPLIEALERLTQLIDELAPLGIPIRHLDIGGGLGIAYQGEEVVAAGQYLERVCRHLDDWRARRYGGAPIRLVCEPGRSIVGGAGALLTRVEYLKPSTPHNFAVVDAAMNDLLRPALYEAWHGVVRADETQPGEARVWDIVGPVCESGDWLARERALTLAPGDVLAILGAGAYGMAMASNYNSRPRPAEVLIDGARAHLIREREALEALYAGERLLP